MQEIMVSLKQKGARLTQTRQLLIAILKRHPLPQTEPELRRQLAARGRTANKTTVYRELQALRQYGVVEQVDFGDGKTRYELPGSHHHHLVCTECGKIKDIQVSHDVERIKRLALKEQKFKIIRHSLEFFGLCKKCNK